MGINGSFYAVHLNHNISTSNIIDKLIDYANIKSFELADQEYLSYDRWKNNKYLFGMAVKPITCFNLQGWENGDDWALITLSYLPETFKGWEEHVCNTLNTFIELHIVCDTVNECVEYLFGKKNNKSVTAKGIEWYVFQDYFELNEFPRKRNSNGELFATFTSNVETCHKTVYTYTDNIVLDDDDMF